MPSSALFTASRSGAGRRPLTARLGRRTKALAPTLAPGALVILDHADLDTVAAQALTRARPSAVVNVSPFVTGRYPNRGPSLLHAAGIPLFEAPDDLFDLLRDGESVLLEGDRLLRADRTEVGTLTPLTETGLVERLAAARMNLDGELTRFAENTLRFLSRDDERSLLLDPTALPELKTELAGKPVLVVVRGEGYDHDLRRLRSYLRDVRPVVLAVDGAADALLEAGVRPHIVLGDMDSISDAALACGAELVVHAYARPRADEGPRAPGLARVESLGLSATVLPLTGTSEDAALLLAYEKGADLIVAVGTHTHLEDFLDKGRGGMASTFLVRLKVGSRLVDARGVSKLYSGGRPGGAGLLFLAASALFPVAVLAGSTPFGQVVSRAIALWWHTLFR